eukprot:m.111700 g.111700  ORF g.111700 m.111700 type:complete len:481 (+) comp21381_c0_seq1:760-2202(+)
MSVGPSQPATGNLMAESHFMVDSGQGDSGQGGVDPAHFDSMLADVLAGTSLDGPDRPGVDLELPFSLTNPGLALGSTLDFASLGLVDSMGIDMAPTDAGFYDQQRQPLQYQPFQHHHPYQHQQGDQQRVAQPTSMAAAPTYHQHQYMDSAQQLYYQQPQVAPEDQFLLGLQHQRRDAASADPIWHGGMEAPPHHFRHPPPAGMAYAPLPTSSLHPPPQAHAHAQRPASPRQQRWNGIAGKVGGGKKGSRLSRFGSYHGTGIEENPIAELAEMAEMNAQRKNRTKGGPDGPKDKKRRPQSRARKEKSGNCVCCDAVNTPLWREGKHGARLCNACGIRWVKYGIACDTCKYVPRKSEASKELCPRCTTPFPPADEEAIRRRSTAVPGAGMSPDMSSSRVTPGLPRYAMDGPPQVLYGHAQGLGGEAAMDREDSFGSDRGGMEASQPQLAMRAPESKLMGDQVMSPFGFFPMKGSQLNRSITR